MVDHRTGASFYNAFYLVLIIMISIFKAGRDIGCAFGVNRSKLICTAPNFQIQQAVEV